MWGLPARARNHVHKRCAYRHQRRIHFHRIEKGVDRNQSRKERQGITHTTTYVIGESITPHRECYVGGDATVGTAHVFPVGARASEAFAESSQSPHTAHCLTRADAAFLEENTPAAWPKWDEMNKVEVRFRSSRGVRITRTKSDKPEKIDAPDRHTGRIDVVFLYIR